MSLHYRPYRVQDRGRCVAIFQTNEPYYFRDHELKEFTDFLDSCSSDYFVILYEGELIGCGGFGIASGSDVADLCWGMVDREQHGKRIGAYLLLTRLHAIATSTEAKFVRLATCQHTEGFFHRYGFETQSILPDGFALGLDQVEMRIELTSANRASIQRDLLELVSD